MQQQQEAIAREVQARYQQGQGLSPGPQPKARPADKTMWAAAARYDPLYGMPTSEGDMTPDFRTYVEDTVASSPIAALFRCIGQIDIPPARDAKLEAFYFAFGSMMNPVIMDAKGITPQDSEPATLSDHELAFLGPGAMAVARAAVGALMHGVLHRIPREALLTLDRLDEAVDAFTVETYENSESESDREKAGSVADSVAPTEQAQATAPSWPPSSCKSSAAASCSRHREPPNPSPSSSSRGSTSRP